MGKNQQKVARFPEEDWTKYSNGALEAMMAQNQPPRQRVFAYEVRQSWGYGQMWVQNGAGKVASQGDIAKFLKLSRQQVSLCNAELVQMDWLTVDKEGRMFPNPYPKPAAADPAAADSAKVYEGLPTREAFAAMVDKDLAADYEAALKKYATVRARQRAVDQAYDAIVVEFGKAKEAGLEVEVVIGDNDKKAAVRVIGDSDKLSLSPNSYPLSPKERKKGNPGPPPTPSAARLAEAKTPDGVGSESPVETNLEPAMDSQGQFETIIGEFIALGRGCSTTDLKKCEGFWKALSMIERRAAFQHAAQMLPIWQARDTSKIPQPWNYLGEKHWERGVPRMLAKTPEKSKRQLAQEELERRVFGKTQGAGV